MKKILVVSDNHGDQRILEKILSENIFDVSVHLGDAQLSEEYVKKNFTYYVGGNHDVYSIYEDTFEIEGVKFAIGHGHTFALSLFSLDKPAIKFGESNNADVVLFGHAHIPYHKTINGIQIINPGALSLPRNPEGASYAILTINDRKKVEVEHKFLNH